MPGQRLRVLSATGALLLIAAAGVLARDTSPNLQFHKNGTGLAQTFSTTGALDLGNEFFQSLGTNGRSCGSCHQAVEGWSITPEGVSARFEATQGLDPIFRTNDGAVCPTADVSTVETRREAYKLLLTRGLIRVSLPIPERAEFQLVAVDDPYECTNASDLALFRRPLPATNLRFLSTVMWDGRESPPGRSLHDNLISQSNNATLGHAQAAFTLKDEQREKIVAFEMAVFTAQATDNAAGVLIAQGAKGGATPLSRQEFFIGINDPLGLNPTGAAFDPVVFRLYEKWTQLDPAQQDKWTAARKAVARGEEIFNLRPITIAGVSGLNDELDVKAIPGTCTTCHDSPNVGNHSVPAPLNIGLVDESQRTPDMPLYTLRCITTGEEFRVTDPGRALVTGKCKDIGRFKGPILRGLAARAPYFHNGSAATLRDAVEFYETRFHLGLTEQEKKDLVAFLQTL
jgi:cytochrome c peroxidase